MPPLFSFSTGFIIWLAGGGLLTAVGIGAFFSKKEVGFFCNVKPLPMRDVKAYNRAVGKLFIGYGIKRAITSSARDCTCAASKTLLSSIFLSFGSIQ